jgi:predicted NAD/FAD-binding protein
MSLGGYVERRGPPREWAQAFLFPTLAANWGVGINDIRAFPAYSVLKVLTRHRGWGDSFLELNGGVSTYVGRLVGELDRVVLRPATGVERIERRDERALAVVEQGGERAETFDRVVLAAAARDAAGLVAKLPGAGELAEVLSRFRHFDTTIAIHGDERLMPARRDDWSMINVFHDERGAWQSEWCGRNERTAVFRSWLRPGDPLPEPLYHLLRFEHLIVTPASRELQSQLSALQGRGGIWTAGMYTTDVDNHESALGSAVAVARALGGGSPNLARLEAALRARPDAD